MSNHVHLIISSIGEHELSAILRDLKKFTSRQLIKSIKEEPESRRNWMLWFFSQARNQNSRNRKYQF